MASFDGVVHNLKFDGLSYVYDTRYQGVALLVDFMEIFEWIEVQSLDELYEEICHEPKCDHIIEYLKNAIRINREFLSIESIILISDLGFIGARNRFGNYRLFHLKS